ncbi:MAG: hypothetical protein FJ207_02945 [Gemmatimonadetes bacterium]|nr:hypothetical protein [Gemmatimonadota bacterium]
MAAVQAASLTDEQSHEMRFHGWSLTPAEAVELRDLVRYAQVWQTDGVSLLRSQYMTTDLPLEPSLLMTVTAVVGGLLPIFWGHGAGGSVMQRVAAPMVGGMISATLLALLVIPAVYYLWQETLLAREARAAARSAARTLVGAPALGPAAPMDT